MASFQYQWTGEVFIKSFLDISCHFDEFGIVILIRTTGGKLTEDGMLRYGCKSRYAAESLLFESVLKLSQCVFPGTVTIYAVKYCLCPVTRNLLQPFNSCYRYSATIRWDGYKTYVIFSK